MLVSILGFQHGYGVAARRAPVCNAVPTGKAEQLSAFGVDCILARRQRQGADAAGVTHGTAGEVVPTLLLIYVALTLVRPVVRADEFAAQVAVEERVRSTHAGHQSYGSIAASQKSTAASRVKPGHDASLTM
jgi:hypothetical protein